MTARAPIPFTVVGGFLGAGKTTLINRLLARRDGLRLVVLVNDFGAVNIDAALIAAQDGDTIALTNGCACCAVGDDFGRGILEAERRRPPPDHIVVEASGVADPGVLAEIARLDSDLTLAGVVVLADATSLPRLAADARIGETVRGQLGAAGLVLLSKGDLASPAQMASARAVLHEHAGRAAMVRADHGDAPSELVLGPQDRPFASGADTRLAAPHGERFATLTLRQSGVVAEANLRAALERLPETVYRAKGFLRLAGEAMPYLAQLVGHRLELTEFAAAPIAERGLVLIGVGDLASAARQLGPLGFQTLERFGRRA